MKRILTTILTLALILPTLACQPTPTSEFVPNKNHLEQAIQTTPAPNTEDEPKTNDALLVKLNMPERWVIETTALNGKLNIKADVPLQLPPVTALPAATASLVEFTNEDLQAIAHVLGIEGATWTEVNNRQARLFPAHTHMVLLGDDREQSGIGENRAVVARNHRHQRRRRQPHRFGRPV